MKKGIITAVFFIAIAAGLYFTGYVFDSASHLEASQDTLVYGKAGGVQKICISTDARRWTVERAPKRIRADRDGDTLILKCDYMDSKMTIIDTLYIKAADKRLAIPVKQYGRATFIRFSPDTLSIPQSGGTATARLETDGEKISALFDKNVDAKIEDGVVTVTLTPNENGYELLSYVLIHSDQLDGKLYYRQPGTGKRNVIIKKDTTKPCPECGGLGKLLTAYNIGSGEKTYKKCHVCNGTGKQ